MLTGGGNVDKLSGAVNDFLSKSFFYMGFLFVDKLSSIEHMSKIQAADSVIRQAGSARQLAHKLKPDGTADEQQRLAMAISKWRKRGVPAAWAPRVARALGIPAQQIRPDLYEA